MSTDKPKPEFFYQLPVIYPFARTPEPGHPESPEPKAPEAPVVSRAHLTARYEVRPPDKPISKLIEWPKT